MENFRRSAAHPSSDLRRTLKVIRDAFRKSVAAVLPWDAKLDRLQTELAQLRLLLDETHTLAARALDKRAFIEEMFVRAHGCFPNLDAPQTFNEKLAWTKLHRCDPIYAELTDKSRAKHYVRQHLGAEFVIASIAEHDSVDELDFASLPSSFMLKPTHGSGWTIAVRDKASADERAIRRMLHRWMSTNYFSSQREPQYRPLIPKLIVERLLTDAAGNPPCDFKLHCFHGRVAYVQVDTDRQTDHRRNFYDRDWILQSFAFAPPNAEGAPSYPSGPAMPRPDKLEVMIEAAEKLAAPFDYVRVDLYLVNGAVLFGELTFTHGAAGERFFPRKWDHVWGQLWQLKTA